MGLERERGNRKASGEILEMGIRSGQKDAGLYDKEKIAKREIKGDNWKDGLGIWKETGKRKRK